LSGAPLLELVIDWLCQAQCAGIKKPINAGGGILCPRDVERLHGMGASSIFIGSAINLRPWRVKKIIRKANELFGKGER
jgi:phosphoribosylformimino-5-aminoimidazole carboxamide ribonucleotide (ProFAR) isomerase